MNYSDSFEKTWHLYPKRNGQKRGKAPAFKVWEKLNIEDQRAAYSDIRKRNLAGGWEFVRDMERYLKHRGWEDEWKGQTVTSDPDMFQAKSADPADLSAKAMQEHDLCKHQIMKSWSYFGEAGGHVAGVVIPSCSDCEKGSMRVMA